MKQLRIDQLISDKGWKGSCVRVVGMIIVYFGIKYLPAAINWGAVHGSISPLSPKQAANHGAVLTVFGWAFCIAISIEIIRWVIVAFRRFR
jgi:hypothetical protein